MKTHCLFLVCVNPNCDSLTSLDFIKLNGRYATSTGTTPQAIALTRLVVFETLILNLLCFSLKIAEVSLSKWAYLVSR